MDDQPFLDAISAIPEDETLRLIYADWLEERGDKRGEYLRLEVEFRTLPVAARTEWPHRVRLLLLHLTIRPDWIRRVARGRIRGCEPRFQSSCPRSWQRLPHNDEEERFRFCSQCRQHVRHGGTAIEPGDPQTSRYVTDLASLVWGGTE